MAKIIIILGILACTIAISEGRSVKRQTVILPPARVFFPQSRYSVDESCGFINICIEKDSITNEDVSMTVKTEIGGSILLQASTLFDYVPIQKTVKIPKDSFKYCFNITIINDNTPGEGEEDFGVSFVINSDSTVAEPVAGKTSTVIEIRDNDDNADVRACGIRDALSVFPFHTTGQSWVPSYNFRGVCEHIFTQDCLKQKFTVVGDFLTRDWSTGRFGVTVSQGTFISKEDGTYSHSGLTILKQSTSSSLDYFGVMQTDTSILFTGGIRFQIYTRQGRVLTHIVTIDDIGLNIHRTYSLISQSVTILARIPLSGELCGLCGRGSTGKLIHADGTPVNDITCRDQADAFENTWLVPGSQQILHDARVECAVVRTDSVIGDPLFEAAILFDGEPFEKALCYEIHGSSGQYYNLISDDCVSVNARYTAMNDPTRGNIISGIAVKAVNSDRNACKEIYVLQNSTTGLCQTTVGSGSILSVGGNVTDGGITVKQSTSKLVTVSVPNCENLPVELSVTCDTITSDNITQHMIRFDVTRGVNLRPTSHGLLGQFWNVPIDAVRLNDTSFIPEEYRENYNPNNLYILTVNPPDGDMRTFIGNNFVRTWDFSAEECLYAGNSQGGPSGEFFSRYKDPVIEGNYRQYKVSSRFATAFSYSQFRGELC